MVWIASFSVQSVQANMNNVITSLENVLEVLFVLYVSLHVNLSSRRIPLNLMQFVQNPSRTFIE
jgi:hypothetical protein